MGACHGPWCARSECHGPRPYDPHGRAGSGGDLGIWDLPAKLLGVPLVGLFGPAREDVAIYGSGGFTSSPLSHLQKQLAGSVRLEGIDEMQPPST